MNRLVLIGFYFIVCVVVAEESVCCKEYYEPDSSFWTLLKYPLSLLKWNELSCGADDTTLCTNADGTKGTVSAADGGEKSSFIERLLLFPVCLLEEDGCDKVLTDDNCGDKGTVFNVCKNADDLSLLEHAIKSGHQAFNSIKTSITGKWFNDSGRNETEVARVLRDLHQTILLHLDHVSSYTSATQAAVTSQLKEYLAPYAEYLAEHFVVSSVDEWVSGTWTTMQHMSREATWTLVRYIIVGMIAMSLFPPARQIGKYASKALCRTESEKKFGPNLRPTAGHFPDDSVRIKLESVMESLRLQTLQNKSSALERMLQYHYPMCECFDSQTCNCGGRSFCEEPVQEITHYELFEVFNYMPDNLYMVPACDTSTSFDTADNSHGERSFNSKFFDIGRKTYTEDGMIATELSVRTFAESIPRDRSSEYSFDAVKPKERLPSWFQMATKIKTCRIKLQKSDNAPETETPLIKHEHIDNSDESSLSALEAGDVSTQSEYDSKAAIKQLENDSPKLIKVDESFQVDQHDSSQNVEDGFEKLSEQDKDEPDYDDDDDEFMPRYLDDSDETESDEDTFRHLNESSTYANHFPNLNSSFKEDSPYTAAKAVSFVDLRDRGDGAVYSTLTKRSPYVEEGLGDLSVNTSCRESESSILDVSDINSSLSFTEGEGILEVAALVALQAIWRMAKQVWQLTRTDDKCNDVAIKEKESGFYIIRQNDVSNCYRSPRCSRKRCASDSRRDWNENNSSNTEKVLYYKRSSYVSKGKCPKSSRIEETMYKWTHSKQLISNYDSLLEKSLDSNNNARHSRRKRKSSKRKLDSDDTADSEDLYSPEKRSHVICKTHEAHDRSLASKKVVDNNSGRQGRKDESASNSYRYRLRRRISKGRSASSTPNKLRRKCARLKNDLSLHSRSHGADLIDRLSRDLQNASVNDHGDTSDEFADESSSSSDEKSNIKSTSPNAKRCRIHSNKPLCCEGSYRIGEASSSSENKRCMCKDCRYQKKHFQDIFEKLRSRRCNVWELKNPRDESRNDSTSKVLAWAWSCVEKQDAQTAYERS